MNSVGFYRNNIGTLSVQNLNINDLAKKYGTPLFIYDGGLMKKAFGGMVDDIPMDERKEDEEINSLMITSNQMPSVRPR